MHTIKKEEEGKPPLSLSALYQSSMISPVSVDDLEDMDAMRLDLRDVQP